MVKSLLFYLLGGALMQAFRDLFKADRAIFAIVIVCIAVVLIAAMFFRYDLNWLPDLLGGLLGG